MKQRLILIILLCITLGSVLLSAQAYAAEPEIGATGTAVDSMIKNFNDGFRRVEGRVYTAAKGLFAALFLCQFVWAVMQLFLQESLTFAAVVATVVRQIMMGGFFYWFLADRTILATITASFDQLASSGVKISELLFMMEETIEILMKYALESSNVFSGFSLFLTALLTCIIMAYAVTTAVGYWALVMLENYIAATAGVILLGFGGSEYTRNYALSYIRTLVHIGFKLFLCTLIIQVGVMSMRKAVIIPPELLAKDSVYQICFLLIAQCFFFLAVVKVIPQISDTLIAGVSMGLGQSGAAIRSGVGGAASLAGGVAMGAGRTVLGAAGTAASATGAAANAYHTSRQSGRSVGSSMASGAGSFMGHSVFGAYATAKNVMNGVRNNLADHGLLSRGPQADTVGSVKKQGTDVWNRHKELQGIDVEKQSSSSMSAPLHAQDSMSKTENADKRMTQEKQSMRDENVREAHVSNQGEVKAPTAEELSKRLGVGGDV